MTDGDEPIATPPPGAPNVDEPETEEKPICARCAVAKPVEDFPLLRTPHAQPGERLRVCRACNSARRSAGQFERHRKAKEDQMPPAPAPTNGHATLTSAQPVANIAPLAPIPPATVTTKMLAEKALELASMAEGLTTTSEQAHALRRAVEGTLATGTEAVGVFVIPIERRDVLRAALAAFIVSENGKPS